MTYFIFQAIPQFNALFCLDIIRRFSLFSTKTRSHHIQMEFCKWKIYTSQWTHIIQTNMMCATFFFSSELKNGKEIWYPAIFCDFFYGRRYETINRPKMIRLIGSWFRNRPHKGAHSFNLFELLASEGNTQNMAHNILLPGERGVLNFPFDFAFRHGEKPR